MRWWKTYRLLNTMKERLSWSPEEIARYRFWKLKHLLEFTYFNSAFYRRYYDEHAVNLDQIKSEADIKRLPILEKSHLQDNDPMEIVNSPGSGDTGDASQWMEENTSGSTGKPLTIYRTWRDLYYIKAKIIRAFSQTGFRFYDRQAVIKSSTDSLTGKHWFERFGILRKYWLAVTDSPGYNLRRLQEIRPQHVHGYPSGLLSIAELLLRQKQTFHIPVICTGAEVLDTAARKDISKAFEGEIFNLYGIREVGNIAWECSAHDGMHINDDAIIVELLDENGNEVPIGEEGEVVVTYLDAMEFPFIRYRIGDRAVRKAGICSCGVTFSRISEITGRSDARIKLPSGEWISGLVFQELRAMPGVSQFRIIQEDTESIKLQIVPKESLGSSEQADIVTTASSLVQDKLKVIPEVMNKLDYDASGKIRAVVCKLKDETSNPHQEQSTEDD